MQHICVLWINLLFFFTHPTPTDTYTLSLHDALPISYLSFAPLDNAVDGLNRAAERYERAFAKARSEEHTSELQSRLHLVCRLLLEKKKKKDPLLVLTANDRYLGYKQQKHVWLHIIQI